MAAEIRRKLEKIDVEELELNELLENQLERVEDTRRELDRKRKERFKFEELAKKMARRKINFDDYQARTNKENINEVIID